MKLAISRRSLLTTCPYAIAAVLCGCAYNSTYESSAVKKSNANIDLIYDAHERATADLEKYGSSHEMIDYISTVGDYLLMTNDPNVTQSDVDKALEDIESKRAKALEPYELPNAIDASGISYAELVESAPDIVGNAYRIDGTITHVTGSFNSKYWELYVRWNDSDIPSESVRIRIDPEFHKSEYRKHFTGNCKFLGLEDSKPVFSCKSDYSGR